MKTVIDSIRRTLKDLHNIDVTAQDIKDAIAQVCPNGYVPTDREAVLQYLLSANTAMVPIDSNDELSIDQGVLAIPEVESNSLDAPKNESAFNTQPIEKADVKAKKSAAQRKAEKVNEALRTLAELEVNNTNQALAEAIRNAENHRNELFRQQDEVLTTEFFRFQDESARYLDDSTKNLDNWLTDVKAKYQAK